MNLKRLSGLAVLRRVMAGAMCLLLLVLARPASAQEGRLHPVTAAEVKTLSAKLDRALLPSYSSHMEVSAKQVFRLAAEGKPDLLLVPVTFWHDEAELMLRGRCGVFLVQPDGAQKFVYTVTGKEEDSFPATQCGDLLAVRRTPHDGPRPALTLTYKMYDPPRFEGELDVVLTWDGKAGTYKVDADAQ